MPPQKKMSRTHVKDPVECGSWTLDERKRFSGREGVGWGWDGGGWECMCVYWEGERGECERGGGSGGSVCRRWERCRSVGGEVGVRRERWEWGERWGREELGVCVCGGGGGVRGEVGVGAGGSGEGEHGGCKR